MPTGQGRPPTPSEPTPTKPARFDYAARLRELLKARGLNAADLAEGLNSKTKMDQNLVRFILEGTLSPTLAEMRKIANLLCVSPCWLFFDEGNPQTTHRAPGSGGLAKSDAAKGFDSAETRTEAEQPEPARCVDASAPSDSEDLTRCGAVARRDAALLVERVKNPTQPSIEGQRQPVVFEDATTNTARPDCRDSHEAMRRLWRGNIG